MPDRNPYLEAALADQAARAAQAKREPSENPYLKGATGAATPNPYLEGAQNPYLRGAPASPAARNPLLDAPHPGATHNPLLDDNYPVRQAQAAPVVPLSPNPYDAIIAAERAKEKSNPYDAIIARERAKNAASGNVSANGPGAFAGVALNRGSTRAKSPIASAGPLDAFTPIMSGAKRTVGAAASSVFDVADRARQATQAALTDGIGKFAPTLMHGQSQAGSDATRAEIRHRMGLDDPTSPLGRLGGTYELSDHFSQGLVDAGIDFFTDPTSLAGAAGKLAKGVDAAGRAALPALSRGIKTLEHKGGTAGRAAQAVGGAFDFMNYKGDVQRSFAAKSGAAGMDQFAGLKSINNARRERASDLGDTLVSEFRDLTKGLSDSDRETLYEAVHTGTEATLPAKFQPLAARFSAMTDSLAHLSGTRGLRADLAKSGFTPPQYAQRFDTQIRSLQRPTQYRKNYVPTAHELDTPLGFGSMPGSLAELDARIAGQVKDTRSLLEAKNSATRTGGSSTTSGLKANDAALNERGDHALLLDPEMQDKVIESRLRSGAAAISARDAEREVSRLFGVSGFKKAPPAAKAFFQETYTKPEDRSFWAGIARDAIDLPKRALFALPFRHMANIGSLSIFADPSLANVFGTAGRFARIMAADAAKDPAAREAAVGKAAKYGVTGTPSIDRDTGWTGRIPILGDVYKASNHALWAFDDAAKAQRFETLRTSLERGGMKESAAAYRAANQVGAELIDYSNRSPFTQALAYIAPFATYRSKLPGAIARTAIRHPERLAIPGRFSPELVGDEQDAPNNLAGKAYLPLAETLRGVDDPWSYARATAGYPLRAAATTLGVHSDRADGGYSKYFNYGKPINGAFILDSVAGAIPGAQVALDAAGLSQFQDQGVAGFVRGQTGVGLTKRPSPYAIVTQRLQAAMQASIDAARARGDEQSAAALAVQLDRYRRYRP